MKIEPSDYIVDIALLLSIIMLGYRTLIFNCSLRVLPYPYLVITKTSPFSIDIVSV